MVVVGEIEVEELTHTYIHTYTHTHTYTYTTKLNTPTVKFSFGNETSVSSSSGGALSTHPSFFIKYTVAVKYSDPKNSYRSCWNDCDGKVTPVNALIRETWQAIESLVNLGLIRFIRVASF